MTKILLLVAVLLLAGLLLVGALCGVFLTVHDTGSAVESSVESVEETAEAPVGGTCTITLSGDSVTIDGPGAMASGTQVTIKQNGDYYFSGTLTGGQLLVDADETASEVRLHLSGVEITSAQGPAIQVDSAQQVYLILEEGTENTLADTADYVLAEGEDEPDAAVYAKSDLVLMGTGTLTVEGNYSGAIRSKGSLSVTQAGTYHLTAVEDGLKGKEQVLLSEATVDITAGEDGIQASSTELGTVDLLSGSLTISAGKHGVKAESLISLAEATVDITAQGDGLHTSGCVQLEGGTLTVDAQQDAIQGDSDVTVSGGTLTLLTGGGAANAPEHTEDMGFQGWFNTSSSEDTASAKGIKAGGDLTLSGGTLTLDTLDDALHCAGVLTVSEGVTLEIATGDDGLHSDDTLNITGGTLNITQSYEGLEAVFINISGGDTTLVASDDGLNAAGGDSADTDFGFMGFGSEGQAETLEEATYYIHITGGTLRVDAGGDGLDSNGAFFMDGGEVYVSGPTDSMNGGLDYTTTGQINGGTIVVAGASGMAQNFDTSSTQVSLMYTFSSSIEAGSTVTLQDSEGNVLVETTMAKSFNNVVISLPDLAVDQTYTLTCGTETAEVTLTDTITSLGSSAGGMGGFGGGDMGGGFGGGGMGGGPGQMGDGTAPEAGDGTMPDMGTAPEAGDGTMPDMNGGPGQMGDPGQMGGDPGQMGGDAGQAPDATQDTQDNTTGA